MSETCDCQCGKNREQVVKDLVAVGYSEDHANEMCDQFFFGGAE